MAYVSSPTAIDLNASAVALEESVKVAKDTRMADLIFGSVSLVIPTGSPLNAVTIGRRHNGKSRRVSIRYN
jgi:hypothetical protein